MSSDRATSVSLCMIVRNEARQLAECLSPIARLFDEIVIVDTGSQDTTCQVARQFTNNVYHFAWRDDFAAARNESLRHASGDWIFWLDADDRISSENREKLARLLAQLGDQAATYFMDTLCRAVDPMDIERIVTHARLFRRHSDICWRRRVHEQLGPWPAHFRLLHTGVQIEHLGYCDRAVVERKQQRNLRLLQMEFAVNADDPEVLLELAILYTRRREAAQARPWFNRLLEIGPRTYLDSQRVLTSLADLAAQEGDFGQVVAVTARGRSLYPHDDYFAYLQAEALYQLGRYPAARAILTELCQHGRAPFSFRVGSPANIRERLAPLGLGEILRVEGCLREAEDVLRSVTDAFPKDPAAWQFLARVYVDLGDRQQFDWAWRQLAGLPGGAFYAQMLYARWHLAHGEIAAAQQIIDRLLGESPSMPLLHLMRAECLARTQASQVEQLRAFRDVLRLKPGQPRASRMVQRLEATVDAEPMPLVHCAAADQQMSADTMSV